MNSFFAHASGVFGFDTLIVLNCCDWLCRLVGELCWSQR